MPTRAEGQLITFAIERDEDLPGLTAKTWDRVGVRVGDTVASICARRGHPEEAKRVKNRNRRVKGKRTIRSTLTVLRHSPRRRSDRTHLWVPRELALPKKHAPIHVLAGDQPPKAIGGYAKFDTVDRPERVGLTHFQGYDPFTIEVPIQFEAWAREDPGWGRRIEGEIERLERMAGRGDLKGLNKGPPPIIRVSTTDNAGNVLPLLSDQFQWSPDSGDAPLWRIAGIDWADGALRGADGNRLRQAATVTLQQHTRLHLKERSVARRTRGKRKSKGK